MIPATQTKENVSVNTITSTARSIEVMAVCPGCKAFQTLQFTDRILMKTRKYIQIRDAIYHDCGTRIPCNLFM